MMLQKFLLRVSFLFTLPNFRPDTLGLIPILMGNLDLGVMVDQNLMMLSADMTETGQTQVLTIQIGLRELIGEMESRVTM